MHKQLFLLVCVSLGCVARLMTPNVNPGVVSVPVANLRQQPSPWYPIDFHWDDLQLTQLLFLENVLILDNCVKVKNWCEVLVPDQKLLINGTWQPYQGWIAQSDITTTKSLMSYSLVATDLNVPVYARSCHNFGCLPSDILIEVSIGTQLPGVSISFGWWSIDLSQLDFFDKNGAPVTMGYISSAFVENLPRPSAEYQDRAVHFSKKMLGWYYLWGGRSAFSASQWSAQTQITGVDCSGLVTLSYRTAGLILPRDADPLFRISHNVTHPSHLVAGDLFFFARTTEMDHVHHVMMFIGKNELIESNFDTDLGANNNNGTRIVSLMTKFGVQNVGDLKWGAVVDKDQDVLYWGKVPSKW